MSPRQTTTDDLGSQTIGELSTKQGLTKNNNIIKIEEKIHVVSMASSVFLLVWLEYSLVASIGKSKNAAES